MNGSNMPPEGPKPGQPGADPGAAGGRRPPMTQVEGPRETAEFPRGFWKQIDYMLHNPEHVRESLIQDHNLMQLCRIFFATALVMSALYGAIMGANNLLQGADWPLHQKCWMIGVTAVKVPLLFLLTLAIVFPPIYVLNSFVGARLTFRKMLALLLASIAITSIVLASMATVAFFFSLTSTRYHFIKLLHVLFFVYAGLAGLIYLVKTVNAISLRARRITPAWLFWAWLFLYMFVGTQLAWVLRPFVGTPDQEFQIFRPRSGNFYESVADSLRSIAMED